MTVREQILANIQTTLEGVTTGNGYNNTLASVQRWSMHGNSLVDVPCVVINIGAESKLPDPNPLMTCQMRVYMDLWVRQAEDDTTPTDTLLNSIFGDIEKALAVDITRGGLAIDTLVTDSVVFETDESQPHAGLTIEINVNYRHQQNDPETAG